MKYGKKFWQSTAERTMGTAVAVALGTLGVDGLDIATVDWRTLASTVGLASLVTVLKCLLAASTDGNPSLGSSEVVATPGATADPVDGPAVEVEKSDPETAVAPQHAMQEGEYSVDEVDGLDPTPGASD